MREKKFSWCLHQYHIEVLQSIEQMYDGVCFHNTPKEVDDRESVEVSFFILHQTANLGGPQTAFLGGPQNVAPEFMSD